MKRLHVHLSVDDLDRSVEFYTRMFGQGPTVTKNDYAKWVLDDPAVHLAISNRGAPAGLDHLGIQTDSADELTEVTQRMDQAGEVFDQGTAVCCYAESDKAWVRDPGKVAWEAFFTTGESAVYGHEADASNFRTAAAAKGDSLALPSVPPAAQQACCEPGTSCAPPDND